jgi:hypothetical protein
MNKVIILNRSYVRSDGTWDESEDTIKSISKVVLENKGNVKWVLLISNTDNLNKDSINWIDELASSPVGDDLIILPYPKQLWMGPARMEWYRFIINNPWTHEYMFYEIDSDDTIYDTNAFKAIVNSDKFDCDLLAFGYNVPKSHPMWNTWTWDLNKFISQRRYITTDIQTIWGFMFGYDIARFLYTLYVSGDLVFKSNAVPEDTLCTIEVSKFNKEHPLTPYRIGALCTNLTNYHIHEGQIHDEYDMEYSEYLLNELKELGYLYVNGGGFYRYTKDKSKFIKFDPYELSKSRNK